MELITNIIIEYLKHNKRLVVPKLGAFIVKQPSGIVRFSELMRNDDGVLVSLLTAYGVKSLEANGMIDRMVFEIRHAITMGEEYTIDGLGTFRAGENNTILFQHEHEPLKIGGNIKPPIATLSVAQRRLRRDNPTPTEAAPAQQMTKPKSQRVAPQPESVNISLIKPDNYLRGLNYDKTKSKKHGEELLHGTSRSRSREGLRIVLWLLLLVAAIVGGWLLWQHLAAQPIESATVYDSTTSHQIEICADTLASDTTHVAIESMPMGEDNGVN